MCLDANVEPPIPFCPSCTERALQCKVQIFFNASISKDASQADETQGMPQLCPQASQPLTPAQATSCSSTASISFTLQDMAAVMSSTLTEVLSKLPVLQGKHSRTEAHMVPASSDALIAISNIPSQGSDLGGREALSEGELSDSGSALPPTDSDVMSFRFKLEHLCILLREVLVTLDDCDSIVVPPEKLSKMDKYLEVPSYSDGFPVPKRISEIIAREWERTGIPFSPSPIFKKMYPIADTIRDSWQMVPKVEGAISTLAKHTTIPIEDSCAFKDPMDKKLEGLLKKPYINRGVYCNRLLAL
ncbi:uncharacterized protein LOC128641574 [Bombina bombina]|uniref:uncharacterized protein LOC128641574 n=1 Tax=Bombina bombina TaxID=8345 RepID=UPI00235A5B85|nr:uncharacterized protein LOC128641574 [Bombina bombina]